MTSSNFVGCSMGRSLGLAPLRIMNARRSITRLPIRPLQERQRHRGGGSSVAHFVAFPPEAVERRGPGPSKDEEDAGGEQHPIQVARVPTLAWHLDPQGRYKHFHGEQACHHTGRNAEEEENTAAEFQDGDEGCHETRERDRNFCKEGGHPTESTRELLVAVNRKQESSHETDHCDAPVRMYTDDAFHHGSPFVSYLY